MHLVLLRCFHVKMLQKNVAIIKGSTMAAPVMENYNTIWVVERDSK